MTDSLRNLRLNRPGIGHQVPAWFDDDVRSIASEVAYTRAAHRGSMSGDRWHGRAVLPSGGSKTEAAERLARVSATPFSVSAT